MEGRVEGRVEGRADLLLRQLQLRFGPISAEIEARVQAASAADVEAWGEHIFEGAEPGRSVPEAAPELSTHFPYWGRVNSRGGRLALPEVLTGPTALRLPLSPGWRPFVNSAIPRRKPFCALGSGQAHELQSDPARDGNGVHCILAANSRSPGGTPHQPDCGICEIGGNAVAGRDEFRAAVLPAPILDHESRASEATSGSRANGSARQSCDRPIPAHRGRKWSRGRREGPELPSPGTPGAPLRP